MWKFRNYKLERAAWALLTFINYVNGEEQCKIPFVIFTELWYKKQCRSVGFVGQHHLTGATCWKEPWGYPMMAHSFSGPAVQSRLA
jgi:hypothetical protein